MTRLVLVFCAAACVLTGCERAMHDMYDQPRYRRMQPAPDLPGGASALPLPDGSVPRAKGPIAATSSARAGLADEDENARAERAEKVPYRIDMPLLTLGRERFTIYCSPCHSPAGDGAPRHYSLRRTPTLFERSRSLVERSRALRAQFEALRKRYRVLQRELVRDGTDAREGSADERSP